MLAGVDAVAEDGFFAERLGGLQPMQALDQNEAATVGAHQIGVCWPVSSMLAAISSTRFCSIMPRRLIGT